MQGILDDSIPYLSDEELPQEFAAYRGDASSKAPEAPGVLTLP
jgi:hypothetical protein